MTQKHIGALLCAVWLVCAALLLNGAVIRIPPARPSAVRVQAAGVASTGTGVDTASAAPAISETGAELEVALYHSASTARNYVLPTGGAGYWLDSSGNNRTFSAPNSTYSPADEARGVVFTGDWLTSGTFQRTSTATLTVVIHFYVDSGNQFTLFSQDASGGYEGLVWCINTWYLSDGKDAGIPAITSAAWHTIVARFDGASSKCWVDGQLKATVDAGVPTHLPGQFRIGAWGAGGYPLTGAIDGLLIYSGPLSDAECADSPNWFN